ncbi:uncharacterized protein Dwil_GK26966 [Drosophila willistoni]|uniref:Uncharacterized protein n=2 Tax=Drosophila willistoni TaxID=7260 RepID=A0A0Q9X616_DROWI|nr:uncharacterized protein Dwil_GK26966 [Drosophila willistoni]
MSRWSTVLIMSAFLLVTVFHSLSPLRYVYPYNYILMLIITELMILGTGAMCSIQSLELMVAVIAIIFFIWICLVAFGAVVHQYVQLNPLCFLTIIFLSFMATVMLIYMQLVLDTQTVLHLCRILVCYSIVAVIIYHSAILHSSEASLFQEDYILSGLLLFVDYICLFILGIMYVQYKNDTNIKPGQVT